MLQEISVFRLGFSNCTFPAALLGSVSFGMLEMLSSVEKCPEIDMKLTLCRILKVCVCMPWLEAFLHLP